MYIVLEIQKQNQDVALLPPLVFGNRNEAEQSYHSKLSFAAVSAIPCHTVVLMDDEGRLEEEKTFYHEA